MRYELDDHPEEYCSLTYEDWCDLMSTIEIKDEWKISAVHIKNIASARAASQSDRDESVSILRRKEANSGVLSSNNSPRRAHDRHHGVQRYCVLCNKAGMPELKYASHSAEDFTSMRNKFYNQGWNGRTYWR